MLNSNAASIYVRSGATNSTTIRRFSVAKSWPLNVLRAMPKIGCVSRIALSIVSGVIWMPKRLRASRKETLSVSKKETRHNGNMPSKWLRLMKR